jgi:hypothetical protein
MSDYSSVACAPGREPEVLDVLRRWMSSQRTMIDLWCKIPGLAADFLPSQRGAGGASVACHATTSTPPSNGYWTCT